MKRISWRLGGRHTQRPALKLFISARVSLQQKRLFNLHASENLCETDSSFHFHRLHCALNLYEFSSSMTRSFKRNMWRAGSGDGHHMEWREFRGGSAAATHSDQLWSHLSQPMSALQPIEAVQPRRFRKLVWDRHFFPFSQVALRFEFGWILFKHDKIFQKKHVKSRKWRWTSYGMKRISWRLGGRQTQRPALKPFISAHVSLQQQCGCTIDLDSSGIRQRWGRLLNLDASVNFCDTGL